ncbi:hypothetical protein BDV25DRAFT_162847 [Aspergillus avenaceus]|uniref:Uncharacterized protein n=1 Tax=Aspergillus avenaceus TaxID=36643 RepID=A0A5N6TIV4_ASPAV|nr:hypothetical protein BDV25DRAFT_162847 [Aspergillus avenaceus]
MEVQVENQKKAHERNVAKESDKAKEIVALSSRLEETRKQLMAEVKARDGCERAAQGQALDWAAQRAALEAKLDALNKKLQSRKDQPQGPVAELQRSHNAPGNYESGINKTGSRIVPPQPPNTRLNHDLTIATPGAVRAKDKKPKKPTLPGDKSAFSITPFLNRIHEPRGSPTSSGDDIDELHAVYVADGIIQSFGNSDRKGNEHEIREHVGSTGSVLRETYRKLPDNSDSYERNKETSSANRQHSNHEQPRLKKRKLGVQRDRNFFEGEDDDDNFRDTRRPGCKLGLNTGRNPASQSSAPSGGSIGRGRGFGAFSGFSPLKRDRKRL